MARQLMSLGAPALGTGAIDGGYLSQRKWLQWRLAAEADTIELS